MVMIGADVQQMRQLAFSLGAASQEMRSLTGDLNWLLSRIPWWGADAQDFQTAWSTSLKAKILAAADFLEQIQRDIENQANQQELASDADATADSDSCGGPHVVPDSTSAATIEALRIVRSKLDTGGFGVTKSDLIAIRDTLMALGPEERAGVIAGLSVDEIAVLRDQMQESPLRRGNFGGFELGEQAAFFRMFDGDPDSLRRLLGDDYPNIGETSHYDGASTSSERLSAIFTHRPGHGEIALYKNDDGSYVLHLPGIEDGFAGFPNLNEVADLERTNNFDSPRDTFYASRSAVAPANRSVDWQNAYAAQVRIAMQAAGVPAGADVMLVGHSFGAYTSLELASDPTFNSLAGKGGYVNVRTVVAVAADVDWRMDDMPPGTSGLIANHAGDKMAFAETALRRNESTAPPNWEEQYFLGEDTDWIGHNEDIYARYFESNQGKQALPRDVADFLAAGERSSIRLYDMYRH